MRMPLQLGALSIALISFGSIPLRAAPGFRISGTLIESAAGIGTQPRDSNRSWFEVMVRDFDWVIRIWPESQGVQSKRDLGISSQYDDDVPRHEAWTAGGEFYSIHVIDAAGRFTTNGFVGPGAVPYGIDDGVLLLWQTFSSAAYCVKGEGRKRPWAVSPTSSFSFSGSRSTKCGLATTTLWQLSANGYPEEIESFSEPMQPSELPIARRVLFKRLTVVGTTNVSGIQIPTGAELIEYMPKRMPGSDHQVARSHRHVVVQSIKPLGGDFRAPLAFQNENQINEWRDVRFSGFNPQLLPPDGTNSTLSSNRGNSYYRKRR